MRGGDICPGVIRIKNDYIFQGITLYSLGGLFVIVAVGLLLTILTLTYEWFKQKKENIITEVHTSFKIFSINNHQETKNILKCKAGKYA